MLPLSTQTLFPNYLTIEKEPAKQNRFQINEKNAKKFSYYNEKEDGMKKEPNVNDYKIVNFSNLAKTLPKGSIYSHIHFIPEECPDFRFVPIDGKDPDNTEENGQDLFYYGYSSMSGEKKTGLKIFKKQKEKKKTTTFSSLAGTTAEGEFTPTTTNAPPPPRNVKKIPDVKLSSSSSSSSKINIFGIIYTGNEQKIRDFDINELLINNLDLKPIYDKLFEQLRQLKEVYEEEEAPPLAVAERDESSFESIDNTLNVFNYKYFTIPEFENKINETIIKNSSIIGREVFLILNYFTLLSKLTARERKILFDNETIMLSFINNLKTYLENKSSNF